MCYSLASALLLTRESRQMRISNILLQKPWYHEDKTGHVLFEKSTLRTDVVGDTSKWPRPEVVSHCGGAETTSRYHCAHSFCNLNNVSLWWGPNASCEYSIIVLMILLLVCCIRVFVFLLDDYVSTCQGSE